MCGIAGILRLERSAVPLGNIRWMTDAMQRRGPDDEGFVFFSSDYSGPLICGGDGTPKNIYYQDYPFIPEDKFSGHMPGNKVLAFGHRRLSIIDPSPAGHQPMCTEDRRYWIVHNGEIYNFNEIKEELYKTGESFYSNTDTEVILKAYRLWGPDCLQRFNGMWAFAIWDDKKKALFCSRDRIGIKPFYYYWTDSCFVFASDIKTLIASKIYTPEPDWEGVYHAMSFYCAPRPMTCFKGVKSLEQAYYMHIDLYGKMEKQRYWQIPTGNIDYSVTEQEWAEQLEDTLREAVKKRLIADVPVGTFMSGGIDSTTISAMAAQEHSGIKAFTLAYQNTASEMDELPQAIATAKLWPMEHIVEEVSLDKTIETLHDRVRCYEEPFQGLSPNFTILELAAKNNVTVVLSGLGGDELFCGYGRDDMLRVWEKIKTLRSILRPLPNLFPIIRKIKNFSVLRDILEVYMFGFSIFSENEKQKLFAIKEAQNWDSIKQFRELYGFDESTFSDTIQAIGYMDLINYIGNHHVYRNDQFSMHFSLETRFPFLDHNVIELTSRIPGYFKVNNGVKKHILRVVAKKHIHHSCFCMKKKGFALPLKDWMQSSLRLLIDSKIKALKDRGCFNSESVDAIYNNFLKGKGNANKLWNLISVELWAEKLIESKTNIL
jgi:asparagine synthase (glutamine-hydrolysing)